MNQIIAAVKYSLKAYIGGCFGCLGALTATILLILVLGFTVGPKALTALQGIQLPSILPLLAPGTSPFEQGTPPMGNPGDLSLTPGCSTTIDTWVSKSDMGDPATLFSPTDGIFPVVTNPTACGTVSVRLVDSSGQTLLEKSYNVIGGGRNGYGDYNPNKDLVPGSYEMQFWYGDILLETIQVIVQ